MNSWIAGLGTAVPATPTPQNDTLDFVLSRFNILERTKQLYKKTLQHKSIEKRYFTLTDLDQVLDQDLDRKNVRFEREASRLSAQALRSALASAQLEADQIDFVAATTCTGYICPGISAHLVEDVGLRSDVRVADLVGMGCGAAVPALEQANNFLAANPGKTAAIVCTEICTAAMFSNDDIDIVISNTIFSDGSAALILRNGADKSGLPRPYLRSFASLIIPEWRDTLRFRTERGHLKNVLGKDVPEQAGEAMRRIKQDLLARNGLNHSDINHWIMHAGGGKVLDAIEKDLDLKPSDLASSRDVLRNYGNMSSPTVLFVLDRVMQDRAPRAGDRAIIGAFGAGFSAYGALVEWI